MDFLELGRRKVGFRVAVEDLEFVGDFQFLEEPEDALRT
jgi:hypothetical protein